MLQSPCNKCVERTETCHATCQRYKDYRAKKTKEAKAKSEQYNLEGALAYGAKSRRQRNRNGVFKTTLRRS